jgi:nucleotide-binding universal stress UspA family protein
MYDEILLPSDGSTAAGLAVDHAFDVATTYGARVHVLYVVDQSAIDGLVSESELVAVALEREGTAVVNEIAGLAADRGVDITTDVRIGYPARTILDYADENDVDLVVMGTHGRRGVDRYLLGSVTERVVRGADVSVLVVRETSGDADAARTDERSGATG